MAETRGLGRQAQTRKGLVATAVTAMAALGGLGFWANRRSQDVERANPPMGGFIEVGGARLHYLSRGQGRPVVFLHGLGGMVQDWHLSVLDGAARRYRAIAFDRPGYGWSGRPRWSRWSPEKQAEILRRAARRMGAERPVVVGHDFGALVALAWALDFPDDLSGVVLLSGYYYPTRRLDVPLLSAPNIAGIGALARNTVTPVIGKAMMPKVMEKVFAPNPVPSVYALYPSDMMLRSSQMRAQGEDLAHLKESTRRLSRRYSSLTVPVVIVAGDADNVVDPVNHAVRLHREVPHSALKIVSGIGHMPHHASPGEVLDAIDQAWHDADVASRASAGAMISRMPTAGQPKAGAA